MGAIRQVVALTSAIGAGLSCGEDGEPPNSQQTALECFASDKALRDMEISQWDLAQELACRLAGAVEAVTKNSGVKNNLQTVSSTVTAASTVCLKNSDISLSPCMRIEKLTNCAVAEAVVEGDLGNTSPEHFKSANPDGSTDFFITACVAAQAGAEQTCATGVRRTTNQPADSDFFGPIENEQACGK